MSFGGLILTNQGRNSIAAAISNEKALDFTHVQLGDGTYNGSYPSKKELTNMVMEIPVTRVARRDNEVTVDCDWNSSQAPRGFYFREIGLIGNGTLCYYDNAGTGEAEYIDPESETVLKEKRIRLTVVVSDDVNVTVHTASSLYALATELDELDKKKVNEEDIHDWARDSEKPIYNKEEIGLGNVDNTADKDKPLSTAMKEAIQDLNAVVGQKSNQSELDNHVNNSAIHFTASERTKLSGIAAGANNYTPPASAAGANTSGLYKITTDANGHVTGTAAVTKSDITALGIPASDTNTTYGTGTSSVAGLTKLYTSTGTSTDGTMTRAAIRDTLRNFISKTQLICNKITLLGHYDGESRTPLPAKNGYIPLAVIPVSTGFTDLCWIQCEMSDETIITRVKNTVDGSRETKPLVEIIWLKTL